MLYRLVLVYIGREDPHIITFDKEDEYDKYGLILTKLEQVLHIKTHQIYN